MEILPAFVTAYSDSSFSNPHQIVSPTPPVFDPQAFTFAGKEMDGLESRRHRAVTLSSNQPRFEYDPLAHNWIEIELKKRASVCEIRVSTKWFTGNQVRAVSVFLIDQMNGRESSVLERVPLRPDAEHAFTLSPIVATHCRIHCFSDGGISRIHFFGERAGEMPLRTNLLERASISHISNEHYGKPAQAAFGNREVTHMLGWESARTGFGEHAVFRLIRPTVLDEIVVDTFMHVFNSPLSFHVFGLDRTDVDQKSDLPFALAPKWKVRFLSGKEVIPEELRSYILDERYLAETNGVREKFSVELHTPAGSPWRAILPFARLTRDTYHRFTTFENRGRVTDLLFMFFPNGGIHALKVYGN